MVFIVKITSDDKSVIELGKAEQEINNQGNFLTNVNIYMETIDKISKKKSQAMLAKVEVFGKIDADESKKLKPLYKALFDWSKSLDKNQWYRTVDIEIKGDGSNDTFRKYHFEKMFVVDYKEFYDGTDNEKNRFELYLTQQELNFKTIEVF